MSADLSAEDAGLLLSHYQATFPLAHYKPSPTQLEMHKSPARHKLAIGGSRSGKTTCCTADLCWRLMGIHPFVENKGPIVAIVLCISRQQAAMVVQRKMFDASELPGAIGFEPFIPPNEVAPDGYGSVKVGYRTYYEVKFRNGSVVYFSWSDDPKTWKRIQGIRADLVYIDENAGNRKLLIECRKRLMDNKGTLLWGATGTEDNDAFEEFRALCMDPTVMDHQMFQLRPGETGAISSQALSDFAATLSEDERRIHIDGTELAGKNLQIYGQQWNDERHLLKADYEPRPEDNLWLGYDPGVDHFTGMVLAALTPARPFQKRIVKCWKHKGKTLDFDIACLAHFLRGRRLAGIVYDTQASNKTKVGKSLLIQMQEALTEAGMAPMAGYYRSVKDRNPGIRAVQQHLDPDHYDKSVDPLLIVNPSVESGGQLLRHEFFKYKSREEGKYSDGIIVKKWDDLLDPLRYLCMERTCAGHNPLWRCGSPTYAQEASVATPLTSVLAQIAPIKTWHEVLLSRSKARGKGKLVIRPF